MHHRFLAGCLLLLGGIPCGVAQPPGFDVLLPSESAGGGNLAVRLTIPPPAIGPRFAEGAPLIVLAPGGFQPGSLAGGDPYALQGFAAVTFLFPGGSQGPFHSEGTYDYRGQSCIDALRDVILFAGGEMRDAQGRTIEQVLPIRVLTDEVGIIGSSNGGPISAAVLGLHGAVLSCVAYYVGWENPTGGQTVACEAGSLRFDCDPEYDGDGNGLPADDGKNPYFSAYSDSTLTFEYARLRFDDRYRWIATDPAGQHAPVERSGTLFLDGNGNGRIDFNPPTSTCLDLDGDGRLDFGDDYLFTPLVTYVNGSLLTHYSHETVCAADEAHLFGTSWPAGIANPEESGTFWALRDATRFYDALASHLPDIHCLLICSEQDHVQADDGHPHIQQAYDGWRGNDIWCRLNPDEAYVRLLVPLPPAPPADNDANTPVTWPAMRAYAEPETLSNSIESLAAVMEMADRTRYDIWDVNLPGPPASVWHSTAGVTPELRVMPTPAHAGVEIQYRLTAEMPAFLRLRDVNGRLCGERGIEPGPRWNRLTLEELSGGQVHAGVFWLVLTSGNESRAERIVYMR